MGKNITVQLSTCGWGYYSTCKWTGDITRPDAEILAECREELNTGYRVDRRHQSDEELLDRITTARRDWQREEELQSFKYFCPLARRGHLCNICYTQWVAANHNARKKED